MNKKLRIAFEGEMFAARNLYRDGQLAGAFEHLEIAHILGQRHIVPHIRSHWWMLRIGVKRHSPAEVSGQVVRIVLGALGSAVGLVPDGNSGGTNMSMFARQPVEPRLAALLRDE